MAELTRSWNRDLMDVTLAKITMETINAPGATYKKCVEEDDGSNRSKYPEPYQVSMSDVSSFGPAEEVFETNSFPSFEPVRGYKKTAAYRKYALSTVFSEEVVDDDLTDICKRYAQEIGKSVDLALNLQNAQLWDNAFATTYYSVKDGAALCSSSHTTRASAATRTNILSGNYASSSLTYQSVQDLLTTGMRQKNYLGYPDPAFVPSNSSMSDSGASKVSIMYQPEDQFLVTKLFTGDYEPLSVANTTNVLSRSGGFSWDMIPNTYTSATGAQSARYWFLLGGEKNVKLIWRKRPATSAYLVNGNKSMAYDVRARYVFYTKDWEQTYGSGN